MEMRIRDKASQLIIDKKWLKWKKKVSLQNSDMQFLKATSSFILFLLVEFGIKLSSSISFYLSALKVSLTIIKQSMVNNVTQSIIAPPSPWNVCVKRFAICHHRLCKKSCNSKARQVKSAFLSSRTHFVDKGVLPTI